MKKLEVGMQVLTFNGIGTITAINEDEIVVDDIEYDISEIQAVI